MSSSTLKAYIDIKYAEKIDKAKTDGVEADPVLEPLVKILAEGQVFQSKDEMSAHLASDKVTKFFPLGTKVDEFSVDNQQFEIYHAEEAISGFREYHDKLQPWIMFYIDAASYIDIDDSNWRFFLIFEKFTVDGGQTRYGIVGYATVYQYYAYPANIRPRISQVRFASFLKIFEF